MGCQESLTGVAAALLGCLCFISLLSSCEAAVKQRITSETVKKITDDFFDWRIRESPRLSIAFGLGKYYDRVEEWNQAAFDRRKVKAEEFNKQVKDLLSHSDGWEKEEDRVSIRILAYLLETYLNGTQYADLTNGFNAEILDMKEMMDYIVKDVNDLPKWFHRIPLMKAQMDDQIVLLERDLGKNITIPRVTMDGYLKAYQRLLGNGSPEESFALEPFKKYRDHLNSTFYDEAATRSTELLNSLKSLVDFLGQTYAPACRTSKGMSALPRGKEAYRAAIRFHTTRDSTPESVHQLGRDEVARIGAAMRQIIADQKFTGSIRDFTNHLLGQPGRTFLTPEEVKTGYNDMYTRVKPEITSEFETIDAPIDFTPKVSAGLGQYSPAAGDKNGAFEFDDSHPRDLLKVVMLPILVHEAEPGHHYQLTLQANAHIPDFRRYIQFGHYGQVPYNWPLFTSYIEGWGLYAEWISFQLGIFETPLERFGAYCTDALRAARLVVDTGIHFYNWTEEQAVSYLEENTALSHDECVAQIRRYIKWPGQACAYKIGQLAIIDIRSKAVQKLGTAFNAKKFHSEILRMGSVPMSLLREKMNVWIEEQAKALGSHANARSSSTFAITIGFLAIQLGR